LAAIAEAEAKAKADRQAVIDRFRAETVRREAVLDEFDYNKTVLLADAKYAEEQATAAEAAVRKKVKVLVSCALINVCFWS
jgi:predicted  nucleic acid-binding Zn-ribbon protein